MGGNGWDGASAEVRVLSFRPSAFDLGSLRVAPFSLVEHLLSAELEAGSIGSPH